MSVRARAVLLLIAMLALVLCAPEGARAGTRSVATLEADHDVRTAMPCAGADDHAVALPAPRPELRAVVGTDAPGGAAVRFPVSGEAPTLLAAAPRERPRDVHAPRAPPTA